MGRRRGRSSFVRGVPTVPQELLVPSARGGEEVTAGSLVAAVRRRSLAVIGLVLSSSPLVPSPSSRRLAASTPCGGLCVLAHHHWDRNGREVFGSNGASAVSLAVLLPVDVIVGRRRGRRHRRRTATKRTCLRSAGALASRWSLVLRRRVARCLAPVVAVLPIDSPSVERVSLPIVVVGRLWNGRKGMSIALNFAFVVVGMLVAPPSSCDAPPTGLVAQRHVVLYEKEGCLSLPQT